MDLEQRVAALRAEYEAKLADLKARYPWVIARRLAEDLLGAGNGGTPIGELLAKIDALPAVPRPRGAGGAVAAPAGAAG